jgi:hypothetical protein
VHLFLVTWMALPAPGRGLPASALRDPDVRAEAEAWSARLGRVGLHWTPEETLAFASRLGKRANAVRNAVLDPADPYYRWCGTWQSWRMFAAPQRTPMRMTIDIRSVRGWRTVYREGGPEDWNAAALRHERYRSLVFHLGWPGRDAMRQRVAESLAGAAARDFPKAQAFRLRLQRERTRRPAELLAGAPIATVGAPIDVVIPL